MKSHASTESISPPAMATLAISGGSKIEAIWAAASRKRLIVWVLVIDLLIAAAVGWWFFGR